MSLSSPPEIRLLRCGEPVSVNTFPADSLLSCHTDFAGHPNKDLKRAIKLRSDNRGQHDLHREFLQQSDSEGCYRKQQLLERIAFDNKLLKLRLSYPAPAYDATKPTWGRFLEAEKQRMETHGMVSTFTARANLVSKKRRSSDCGPHSCVAPELKRKCIEIGINPNHETVGKKKAVPKEKKLLLAEYLAKSPST